MESRGEVRALERADLPAVTAIYAKYVLTSTSTFELEPPDVEEMGARWTAVKKAGLPFLVVEVEGVVAGYAYAMSYRARPAYRFTVEDTIYLDPDYCGQGLGTRLLEGVIAACREAGRRRMLAVIGGSENVASIRLHEKCGFRKAGTLEGVGFKFGQWLDTVVMQREL